MVLEFICYIIVGLLILIGGLIQYGIDKTRPYSDRIFNDEDIAAVMFISSFWPIVLAIFIIIGVFKLPILLGEYIGKRNNTQKAKKEFKEAIKQKK